MEPARRVLEIAIPSHPVSRSLLNPCQVHEGGRGLVRLNSFLNTFSEKRFHAVIPECLRGCLCKPTPLPAY